MLYYYNIFTSKLTFLYIFFNSQMPRTPGNKLDLALENITKLCPTYDCISFHTGVTKCKCIQAVREDLVKVKKFFCQEVDEFWKIEAHWSHRKDAKAIGQLFGEYIFARSTHTSKFNMYVYHIANKEMLFCLNTLIRIYGLNQDAMTAACELLIDRKRIGMNLLKKACFGDLKSNQKLSWVFSNWFGHQIIPMGPKNKSAASIIKKLGGFMLVLSEASMSAVDYINAHHCPKFADLTTVSHGGDNIMFGSPGNNLDPWGSFDDKEELKPFMEQVRPKLFEQWKNKEQIVFNYETSFIYSKLSETRDNVPQEAHQDHDSDVTSFEVKSMGIESMIGFTPISEDGMMIVVWTHGKPKKYRSQDKIDLDLKRQSENEEVAPGQYYLYIPRGVFVALPGSTIHAGVFCFGKKEPLPVHPSKKTGRSKTDPNETLKTSPDEMLQNHRLHFSFLCSKKAHDFATGETKISVIKEKKYFDDYIPDPNIMKILFECLLDRHTDFVPIKDSKKRGKSITKIPKGKVASYQKK